MQGRTRPKRESRLIGGARGLPQGAAEPGFEPVETRRQPVALQVRRGALQSYGVSREPLGDCVAVRAGGVDIVLNTLRTQAFGPELFTNVGIDPASRRIVVVKSSDSTNAHTGGASEPADNQRHAPGAGLRR